MEACDKAQTELSQPQAVKLETDDFSLLVGIQSQAEETLVTFLWQEENNLLEQELIILNNFAVKI